VNSDFDLWVTIVSLSPENDDFHSLIHQGPMSKRLALTRFIISDTLLLLTGWILVLIRHDWPTIEARGRVEPA
jgi:hypothetical protein